LQVVNPTRRVLAVTLLGGLLVALDLVGIARTGLLGFTFVVLVVAVRVYAVLAQVALASCRVRATHRGSVEGRDINVEYEVCNDSLVPIALVELSLNYPWYLKLSKGSRGGMVAIPPRGCVEYRVSFKGRTGLHRIGPLKAVFRDPLGLYRGVELELGPTLEVKVRPVESERLLRALLQVSRATGISRSRRPGEGVEFYDVREYRPGDELRRIHWKALARGKLAVKEFEFETATYTLLVLVLDETMLQGPYLETPFEQAARIASLLASLASRRGDYVALLVLGSGAITSTRFGRGKRGYSSILRAISSIDYERYMLNRSPAVEALVENRVLLAKHVRSLLPREKVNILVLASTAETSVRVAKNIAVLRRLGYTVNALILVPQLYGLQRLTPFERAVYRLRVYEELKTVYKRLRELRAAGVNALIVTPWDKPSKLLSVLYGV